MPLQLSHRCHCHLTLQPYYDEPTELHCIKKLRSDKDDAVDADCGIQKAQACWIRQLQQIPQLSLQIALNIAKYYPTPKSLWDMYQSDELDIYQKRALLAHILGEIDNDDPTTNTCSSGRVMVKMSDDIYRFMTSDDPMEFIL